MTDIEALASRYNLLRFIQSVRQDSRPLLVGVHTREITARLDRAVDDYRAGKSTYLLITVPFRHGKSEIVSRHFPPYFLGHFPDAEMILATYGQTLSNNMSRDARRVIKSPAYRRIFNRIRLSAESSSVTNWQIDGRNGKFQAITISAGGTGKGADVLIVDDYLRGRSVAESALVRDTQWENFSGNLMTRLAPVHIVVILATPWHPDDIIGRIKRRLAPGDPDFDADFPPFELMKFPARRPDGTYLFPERFSEEWYIRQFAILGSYQSAALLQCEPVLRGGNILKSDRVQIIEPAEWPKNLHYVRFWDLASGRKERIKDDPDSTAGVKAAVKRVKGLWHLYIDDIRTCQAEAPERNAMILRTTEEDGAPVEVGVESVAGYKDTYTTLKRILEGRRIIHKINVSQDKVIRAGELEPLFEAGHVYMKRAYWNRAALDQLGEFPAGSHDDIVDAIGGAFEMARRNANSLPVSFTV